MVRYDTGTSIGAYNTGISLFVSLLTILTVCIYVVVAAHHNTKHDTRKSPHTLVAAREYSHIHGCETLRTTSCAVIPTSTAIIRSSDSGHTGSFIASTSADGSFCEMWRCESCCLQWNSLYNMENLKTSKNRAVAERLPPELHAGFPISSKALNKHTPLADLRSQVRS